ncbi:MAG TPA: SDR family NAD(P)-dependent oxidoreductase [Bacteroidales bacterium]|nr:SDR family NAD(P)-dependent oxidoreductase [Bacteroidales bacterium]HRW84077.1 SDR family NAD(P)-dependent oxidoreductase [Bacteroidales bacterium]
MYLKERYGKQALIAGASEGIGAEFSLYLAKAGINLVLIARGKEKLESFASFLEENYHIKVQPVSCDLSDNDSVNYLTTVLGNGRTDILVYNAALSYIGPFEADTDEHMNRIMQANMITPLNLVKRIGGEMAAKGRGAIILMSSLAGLQGSGFLSSYASTKAFNRILAESLWYEWKDRGVDVIACCAGATSTENYIKTNPGKPGFLAPRVTTPREVVEECFRYLGKRPSFIAGTGNRIAGMFMQRILPRRLAVKIMGDNTRKIYRI